MATSHAELARRAVDLLDDEGLLEAALRLLDVYDGDRRPHCRIYELARIADVGEGAVSTIVQTLTGALLLDTKSSGVCKSGLWDEAAPAFRSRARRRVGRAETAAKGGR